MSSQKKAILCALLGAISLATYVAAGLSEPEDLKSLLRENEQQSLKMGNSRVWQSKLDTLLRKLALQRAEAAPVYLGEEEIRRKLADRQSLYGIDFQAFGAPQASRLNLYDLSVIKRAARSRHCLFNAVDCID